MDDPRVNEPVKPACPICGRPVSDATHRPFCSKRCQQVDLHRWLGGVYRVETDEGPDREIEGEGR